MLWTLPHFAKMAQVIGGVFRWDIIRHISSVAQYFVGPGFGFAALFLEFASDRERAFQYWRILILVAVMVWRLEQSLLPVF